MLQGVSRHSLSWAIMRAKLLTSICTLVLKSGDTADRHQFTWPPWSSGLVLVRQLAFASEPSQAALSFSPEGWSFLMIPESHSTTCCQRWAHCQYPQRITEPFQPHSLGLTILCIPLDEGRSRTRSTVLGVDRWGRTVLVSSDNEEPFHISRLQFPYLYDLCRSRSTPTNT